jgi:hypothetical protein
MTETFVKGSLKARLAARLELTRQRGGGAVLARPGFSRCGASQGRGYRPPLRPRCVPTLSSSGTLARKRP